MCLCVTVNDWNGTGSKSVDDDGTYRPNEHNNDGENYRFGYKVNAIETGDIKQHTESRVNNDVNGAYFVYEPNGVSRMVQYIATSDGFKAFVRHRFGVKYSKNSDTNKSIQSDPSRQALHTSILNKIETNDEQNLSQRPQKVVAFDRFLPEPEPNNNDNNNKNPQQIGTFRKSSPKPITNQSSIRLSEASSGEETASILPESVAIPASSNLPPVIGRRRQYEVIDPNVDIDIRRHISKPYLNLDKLKQPRIENNK